MLLLLLAVCRSAVDGGGVTMLRYSECASGEICAKMTSPLRPAVDTEREGLRGVWLSPVGRRSPSLPHPDDDATTSFACGTATVAAAVELPW